MGDIGRWNKTSFLNHNCAANCSWFTIADFIFVSANCDIRRGEELTISYMDMSYDYHIRQKILGSKTIRCTCEICRRECKVEDELRPLVKEFESFDCPIDPSVPLNDTFRFVSFDCPIDSSLLLKYTARMEHITSELKKLMPPPSPSLARALALLSDMYICRGLLLQAAKAREQSLHALSTVDRHSVAPQVCSAFIPLLAFQTALLYEASGNPKDSEYFSSVGKSLALNRYCASPELIRYFYSTMPTDVVEFINNLLSR